MAPEMLERILDNMLPSRILCLQGIGEPTLHPQLFDLITLARAKGKYEYITFNSNILARDMDYWRELKRLGIRHFSVSVDSLTQAVAERCRAGTQVDKLRERLTQLVQEGFVILVSIVLSRLNLDDLPQTLRELDRIARLGTMAVEIQPLIPYDGGDPTIVLDEEAMAKYHQMASQIRPSLRYLAEFQEAAALTHSGACDRPFTSPYVTVDGYLTPCCTTNDASLFGFLRADLLPFERLWNHPTVQAWRANYRRQSAAICGGCAFNPATAVMTTVVA